MVNTTELMDAVEFGKVAGACLDVLEFESVSFEHLSAEQLPESFQRLRKSDKVILSPHVAGWTFESHVKLAQILAGKIAAILTA